MTMPGEPTIQTLLDELLVAYGVEEPMAVTPHEVSAYAAVVMFVAKWWEAGREAAWKTVHPSAWIIPTKVGDKYMVPFQMEAVARIRALTPPAVVLPKMEEDRQALEHLRRMAFLRPGSTGPEIEKHLRGIVEAYEKRAEEARTKALGEAVAWHVEQARLIDASEDHGPSDMMMEWHSQCAEQLRALSQVAPAGRKG